MESRQYTLKLYPNELLILKLLKTKGGLNKQEIKRELGYSTHQGLHNTLGRMELKGYINVNKLSQTLSNVTISKQGAKILEMVRGQ